MTYNVFGGTLSLTQSINHSYEAMQISILCNFVLPGPIITKLSVISQSAR